MEEILIEMERLEAGIREMRRILPIAAVEYTRNGRPVSAETAQTEVHSLIQWEEEILQRYRAELSLL